MTARAALALEDVGLVHANGQRALHAVTLRVAPGARVAIIGPSGAGKTSLLRIAATALRASEGRVEVLGARPWQLRARPLKALRARIGLIHQAPPIPPRLRVVTAVLAGRLGAWSGAHALASLLVPADIAGAQAVLARLDLADRLFDRCDRLSGGQLQRVGMARVLYQAPELLLADEPVSALDPALADLAVGELIAQSQSSGATVVASLHAVDLALKWFDRIVGLRAGVVVFDAPAAAVSRTMLQELYATEGGALPTQAPDFVLEERRAPVLPVACR
ncbi:MULTISPECIES: ATP-binding cassette domain-containing protein [unclassified Variovorax]|uniref:phosphonate ABC transporter ATP-binding protein n=1 Tax=unclassified Variovorax TaxID=663243 RepID=UPI00076D942D|nr:MULTISPECIES: ATP-binding cassette domain-containing protein [unclassified Variovorax]KWT97922.1 Phosphonate ABC transporter ATP-binding protein [Variovorax sp. WDL1]PNG59240.1 Phosphate-import ATP-binding protein PhnC [Variovorax sp. B4]PNG60969.1 Phosphate-import ATP-binding protein PhnC [Variovorax sp. B2]VTV13096.1 Phosphate-import ATP-binding protein PhnC [Variovorax sp. WDL1]